MITIIKGQSAKFSVTILNNGSALAVDPSGEVQAQIFTADGSQSISDPVPCLSDADGANWDDGVIAIDLDAIATSTLDVGAGMLVVNGPFGVKRFRLSVETIDTPTRSQLFIRDFVIEEIRSDQLMAAASRFMGGESVTDEYIWRKIVAAEAYIARELRVPLVPTKFFPGNPSPEQIEALNGMPWAVDPGYDYHQDMFFPDKWGMIKLNNRPLIEVESVDFDFPTMGDTFFKMPIEWLRSYDKYGHIQFVPSTPALFSTAGTFVMRALTGYNLVPLMVKITYTAGIENAARDYPDLIDAIKKTAVLRAIEDSFPAQSGSISADGLSQSVSVEMAKYRETVNTILHGEPGTNGGLMGAIHGIRTVVL